MSELEKKIQALEKRVSKLESIFPPKSELRETKPKDQNDFRGLVGGIRFLISRNFLSTPKTVNEILDELKKEGYHYPYDSVNKIVSVNLMQKQKILTRVKEDNVWKYVLRK
jgi:hypothetical protein